MRRPSAQVRVKRPPESLAAPECRRLRRSICMRRFPYAHATHPQWQMASALVLAQLRAQMALQDFAGSPSLGLIYITDHYAGVAQDILDHLSAELAWVSDWAGTVGVGIASNNVEYFDEPALAVMLLDIPSDQYRVFSGVAPLSMGFEAHTALVHADGNTVELSELVEDMARRTDSGYLFGGISSSRGPQVQFAVSGDGTIRGQGSVSGVFSGGLSGVAFGAQLGLVSRVTQGCKPLSTGMHTVTDAEGNVVYGLNGQPALDVMLAELAVTLQNPQMAMEAVRATLVGLGPQKVQSLRRGNFGDQVRVRHIIGLDPGRRGIAVAEHMQGGMQLAFCQRNVQAAKADLKRICAEIREELEPEELSLALAGSQGSFAADAAPLGSRGIAGAIYVSCSGRGGAHFGGPSAELQMVRAALGDVPLVGFFAGGEIAYDQLYGYTGVLTVFPMQ